MHLRLDDCSLDALAKEAQNGNHKAYARLCEELHRQIFAFLMARFLGSCSQDDLADLTHDVLVRAAEKLSTFNPAKGTFRVWILTIAANLTINFLRRGRRRILADMGPAEEECSEAVMKAISESAEGFDAVISKRQQVAVYLMSVTSKQRAALQLVYMEELEIKEAAKILNMQPNAVYSLLNRAVLAIRAKYCPEETPTLIRLRKDSVYADDRS